MKVKTKSIRASSGITIVFKGNYYKFNYEEEQEVMDCTDEEVKVAIKQLFEKCNGVIDDQVLEVTKVYGSKQCKQC